MKLEYLSFGGEIGYSLTQTFSVPVLCAVLIFLLLILNLIFKKGKGKISNAIETPETCVSYTVFISQFTCADVLLLIIWLVALLNLTCSLLCHCR